MYRKLAFFVLLPLLTISSVESNYNFTKCSEAPETACGPFAKCFDQFEPTCFCDVDAYGKPPNCKSYCLEPCKSDEYCDTFYRECRKGCKYNENCEENEFCDDETSQCKTGCRSNESCKSGQICNFETRNCEEVCRHSSDCKSDEFCHLETLKCKKGCRSNEDCPNGLKCDFHGMCKDFCQRNEDCKSTEFCDFEILECKVGCQSDQNCKSGEYCKLGDCIIQECRVDEDCSSNAYCNFERKCLEGCRDNSCDSGYYCSYSDHTCVKGSEFIGQAFKICAEFCKPDEYCDTISGICTKGCSENSNCNDGLVCNLQIHKCTEGCKSDDDCDDNKFCNQLNNQCEFGCRGDFNCNAKEICDLDHKCIPGCNLNSHCKTDEFCYERTCKKNCVTSPCGQNSKCSAALHEELCSCLDGFFYEKGIGCQQKTITNTTENLSCSNFCGPNSKCMSADNEIYCFCPKPNIGNPYIQCSEFAGSAGFGGTGTKPAGETPLSAACFATLCAG